ncbi:MAG: quinolinate synthase NadA [Ruminococcaceae bacterium]|nr:quinolinate synthase NadA [Oscillospiraceae bacterium]
MEKYNELQREILKLKKEKNALILAHYYVPVEVQAVADAVCDSFAMAKLAKAAKEDVIVICGVRFMGESAKLLSPDKTVLLPAGDAGCPMADTITAKDVLHLKEKYPEAAVVCYVNSSAAVKAVSTVCCTSSSALKVVRSLPEKEIIFIPDKNLGTFVAENVPEKTIHLYDGCCPIHNRVTVEEVLAVKARHPEAVFAVHPECCKGVVALADFVGSTAEIIDFVKASDAGEFIIGTECEISRLLSIECPDKKFYNASEGFICHDMKKVELSAVRDCLKNGTYEVCLTQNEIEGAENSLDRMVRI